MTRPLIALTAVTLLVLARRHDRLRRRAPRPRASLTDIENDVMCVSCSEPLIVAQSPQATPSAASSGC